MHLKLAPVLALLLASCATTQSSEPSSLSFSIPKGSTLSLNKNLDIPDGKTHATLQ